MKDTLKQCEITPSDLESLARDRTTWRTTCRNAVQRFEEKQVTIWLRSDSYARLNHHCLGPSDVPPAVGCVNPGSDYFHTTGVQDPSLVMVRPVVSTAQSVNSKQLVQSVLRPSSPTPSNGIECIYASAQHIQSVTPVTHEGLLLIDTPRQWTGLRLLNTLRRPIGLST